MPMISREVVVDPIFRTNGIASKKVAKLQIEIRPGPEAPWSIAEK